MSEASINGRWTRGTSEPARRRSVGFLQSLPVLSRTAATNLSELAASVDVRGVRRGRPVWCVGEPAAHVVIVRSGVVRLSVQRHGRREATIGYFPRRTIMGWEGMSRGRTRTTRCEAWEDAVLWTVPQPALVAWLQRHPDQLAPWLALGARRTSHLLQRLSLMTVRHAPVRLATALLELIPQFGVRDGPEIIVDLRMTHRELGALIGATRETVSVAIDTFRRQGLIRTEPRRIVILREHGLREVADAR